MIGVQRSAAGVRNDSNEHFITLPGREAEVSMDAACDNDTTVCPCGHSRGSAVYGHH